MGGQDHRGEDDPGVLQTLILPGGGLFHSVPFSCPHASPAFAEPPIKRPPPATNPDCCFGVEDDADLANGQRARVAGGSLNSFIFNFDTTGKVIGQLLEYEYFGYPADFLEITKKNIEKVTKADVLRVAKQYLIPGRLRFVVLGKPSEFDGTLDEFGKVNKLDITIPGAPENGANDGAAGK